MVDKDELLARVEIDRSWIRKHLQGILKVVGCF